MKTEAEIAFEKEFEDSLKQMEVLKKKKRAKRQNWLRKYNKLRNTFLVEDSHE